MKTYINFVVLLALATLPFSADAGKKEKRKRTDSYSEMRKKQREDVEVARIQVELSQIQDYLNDPEDIPLTKKLVTDLMRLQSKLSPREDVQLFLKARIHHVLGEVYDRAITTTRSIAEATTQYRLALEKFEQVIADDSMEPETTKICHSKMLEINFRLALIERGNQNFDAAAKLLKAIIDQDEPEGSETILKLKAQAEYTLNLMYYQKKIHGRTLNVITEKWNTLAANLYLDAPKRIASMLLVAQLCCFEGATLFTREQIKGTLEELAYSHTYPPISLANLRNLLTKIYLDEGTRESLNKALTLTFLTIENDDIPNTHVTKLNAHLLHVQLCHSGYDMDRSYRDSLIFISNFKEMPRQSIYGRFHLAEYYLSKNRVKRAGILFQEVINSIYANVDMRQEANRQLYLLNSN